MELNCGFVLILAIRWKVEKGILLGEDYVTYPESIMLALPS